MRSARPSTPTSRRTNWAPQPGPQAAALQCPFSEIFFGGSRGGGKSDCTLGRMGYRAQVYGRHYNGIIFRTELPQSDDLIERAREIYEGIADYQQQRAMFLFRNGARVRFRPLRTVADAQKYQGQNLTDASIEEAGTYPEPAPILRLFGALRSAHKIPTCLWLTGNPGGPGQQWLAARYVHPAPGGRVPLIKRVGDSTHTAIYIPSRVQDNRLLLESDPGYISRLHLVGSAELVRAWLEGDWSAIEGAYFDCWGVQHVCEPFQVPAHWLRFRSMDWGSARPFSVGWWAIASDDTKIPNGVTLPRGGMLRYREWYGRKGPNEGIKATAEEVARGILERSPEQSIYTTADPAMFAEDGGPSLAERFARAGVVLMRADNKRTTTLGHQGGWDMLRQRLIGEGATRPMVVAFSTCADSIRTIPALQHDAVTVEDVDTEQEDHAADEWRYASMSRPWIRGAPVDYDPLAAAQQRQTFNDMLREHDAAQQARRRL